MKGKADGRVRAHNVAPPEPSAGRLAIGDARRAEHRSWALVQAIRQDAIATTVWVRFDRVQSGYRV